MGKKKKVSLRIKEEEKKKEEEEDGKEI